MCGIIAIYSQTNVAQALYEGMKCLQHRGQDAAGMITLAKHFCVKQGLGKIHEVFAPQDLASLQGQLGIGHTRYPTAGTALLQDVQPFYTQERYKIALAHSGHLLQTKPWQKELKPCIKLHSPSGVDSNLLLHYLATQLDGAKHTSLDEHFFSQLCRAVNTLLHRVEGSYAVVCLIENKGLVAFRDPLGIRPLVLGQRQDKLGHTDYVIASESLALDHLGYDLSGDIAPGELIYINQQGQLYRQQLTQQQYKPCAFEYVYFARSASIMNGVKVEAARQTMGKILADYWKKQYAHIIPDYVIPIPQTSSVAASAFAQSLGFNYAEKLIADNSVGRSFIMPNPNLRRETVRKKFLIDSESIKNKTLLLFDDSIVRGTTATEIVQMLKEQGAGKVYFVAACPPILNTCEYGINIPTQTELVAVNHSVEQIRQLLGVDLLLYPTTDDLKTAILTHAPQAMGLCLKCMMQ